MKSSIHTISIFLFVSLSLAVAGCGPVAGTVFKAAASTAKAGTSLGVTRLARAQGHARFAPARWSNGFAGVRPGPVRPRRAVPPERQWSPEPWAHGATELAKLGVHAVDGALDSRPSVDLALDNRLATEMRPDSHRWSEAAVTASAAWAPVCFVWASNCSLAFDEREPGLPMRDARVDLTSSPERPSSWAF